MSRPTIARIALLGIVAVAMSIMWVRRSAAALGRGRATRSVVWAQHGMVCAAQPLAVQAGVDILKQGGSAVDAAIATNACLGLMEPTANGLGGDLFAIVWDPKTKELAGLNGSGRAPLALTVDRVKPTATGTIPLNTPFAWSVPGCVDGWTELHKRYGKLPLRQVLAPAIAYAEEGFPLSPVIAAGWGGSARRLVSMPGFKEVFMPGGRAPREGELFKNRALARTLREIGEGGRDAFYQGRAAKEIVKFSQANGGFFALEDFARHKSTWDQPISTDYHGYMVWELPPNGQGLAALQMLNVIENFDLKKMGTAPFAGRDSADFWHVLIEAKKLAFADRARYYADPAFARVPVPQLLSKEYAKERAKLIDLQRAAQSDPPGEVPALNQKETTYMCAADNSGMMVSLIQSNYQGFGSGHAVPEVGIGLQNRGGLFSLKDGHPNCLEPGKRPFHTIIPAFVTKDGKPLMAFGLMGGDMQPQGHAQIIVNLLDFGMNLQEAGDAIRFYHTGSSQPTGTVMRAGGALHLEEGLPSAIIDELKRRGHTITPASTGSFGGYQAIWRDHTTHTYAGATEKRKDGCALGY